MVGVGAGVGKRPTNQRYREFKQPMNDEVGLDLPITIFVLILQLTALFWFWLTDIYKNLL
jgi:hypothetical protein